MRAFHRFVGIFSLLAYAMFSAATPALADSALDLGSSSAYVTFGTTTALGASTFTVETWFKREGTGVGNTTGTGGIGGTGGPAGSLVPLISKGAPQADGTGCPGGTGNCDANYILGINTNGNVLAADFEDFATGLNHPVVGVTPIVIGLWYHAAATYDGTTWRLYLNGQLEAQLVVGAFTPRYDNVQGAALGTMLTTTGTALGFFDGVLDEARVWNTARTLNEIRSTMNQAVTSGTGLIARWGLDEGTGGAGTTIADSVPPPQDGAIVGTGTSWVANAPFDIAPCNSDATTMLSFDGSNDYVTFGNPASLKLATFTVETWFNRQGTGATQSTGTGGIASFIPLVTKGSGEGETPANINENYLLGIDNATNRIAGDYEEPTGPNHPLSGTSTIANNRWYHAAITYDGTTFRIYLDGVEENSIVAAAPASTSDQHVALSAMLTTAGTAGTGRFAGLLDEVRIWNVARTGAQIASDRFSEITSATGLVARWGLNEGTGTTTTDSVTSIVGTLTNGPSWFQTNLAANATGACDDDLFCNGDDTCNGAAGGLRCAVHAGDPCLGGSECADTCDEVNDTCNDPIGTDCGSDGDTDCDNPDTCDGSGNCQANYEPGTTVCRADAGECDVAEYCNGSGSCPSDGFEPNGSGCTDGLYCTGTETCTGGVCGGSTGDPCPGANGDGNCSESCDETNDNCTAADPNDSECTDGLYCTGTETCTGGVCGGSTGDPCPGADGDGNCSESCDESADNCTAADPAGSSCGDPSDNACTDPDTCDGSGTCSANDAANGTPCGDQSVACHVDDTCQSGACQDNGFATPGSACGDASDTECTNPDTCSPIGTCLANDADNGSPCGDQGVDCLVDDTCQSGSCQDNGYETAGTLCTDEPDVCTDDTCDGAGVCTHVYDETNDALCALSGCDPAPRTGCFGSERAQLQVKGNVDPARNQLVWKWQRGDELAQSDLGDPVTATTYYLCIYDQTASAPALVGDLRIDPNAAWVSKDPKGFIYKDKVGTEDGVQKGKLKTGVAGKSQAQVKAKGLNLPLPAAIGGGAYFDADPSVVAQLVTSEGKCWTTEFTVPTKNEDTQYKAKVK